MKEIRSNMTGTVLRVLVKPGEKIQEDQDVVALESMKMEMMVPATATGIVKEIKVSQDEFVQEGQVLLTVE